MPLGVHSTVREEGRAPVGGVDSWPVSSQARSTFVAAAMRSMSLAEGLKAPDSHRLRVFRATGIISASADCVRFACSRDFRMRSWSVQVGMVMCLF